MKRLKILPKAAGAFLFITVLMLAICAAFNTAPLQTFVGVALFVLVAQDFKHKGALRSGLYPELWTGELINKFRWDKEWLSLIPRRDDLVKSNAIHMVDIGADPAVLVNNTTYPIAAYQRTDADLVIGLDKFDTENTIITDDELYNLPYDKPGTALNVHRLAMEDMMAVKSAHSLAAQTATAKTPVFGTTGAADGRDIAHKMLTPNDIIKAKDKLDDLKIPLRDRLLLLSTRHVNDLLTLDEKFAYQYKNMQEGTLFVKMYGFTIAEFGATPVYRKANGIYTKQAFGAAADPTQDLIGSLFFYTPRTIQSVGTATMYYSQAALSPRTRQSEVGFRAYQMCLPKKVEGFGAIVSEPVS